MGQSIPKKFLEFQRIFDYFSLECAEKVAEVGMAGAEGQDFPLDHRAFDVVVFEDDVLFETFDGVVAARILQLGE